MNTLKYKQIERIDTMEYEYEEEFDEELHRDLQDLIQQQFEEMVFRLFDEYEMK